MTDKPTVSQGLVDAFNAWFDQIGLTDDVRVLLGQTLMTGDYSNHGRPKFLTVSAYGPGLDTLPQELKYTVVEFYLESVVHDERPHTAMRILGIENELAQAKSVVSAADKAQYQDAAPLNSLIQKLIGSLSAEQQTKAIALAVYFTAAVRWCVVQGYQLLLAHQITEAKAPELHFRFYHPEHVHAVIELHFTPYPQQLPDFSQAPKFH